MRPRLYLLIILAFMGCSKSSVRSASVTGLVGKWEIRARQAGMIIGTTFPEGNGHTIEFTDKTFTEIDGGQVVRSGSYSVRRESTVDNQTCTGAGIEPEMDRIIYDPADADRKTFIVVNADTLTTYSGCFALDGGIYVRYQRIQGKTN